MCVVWWTDAYSEDVHNSPSDSHPDMLSLPHEGELDFYETNCHWRGCGLEFDTQDDLVRVLTAINSRCSTK